MSGCTMAAAHRFRLGLCLAACLLLAGIPHAKAWEVAVKDESNKTCIYANMLMNFTITYETESGTLENASFVAPSTVKSNRSTCDTVSPRLVIDFDLGHSWSLNFTKNNATYEGSMIVFTYNMSDTALFPDSKAKGMVSTETPAGSQLLTDVQIKTKYRCSHPTTVNAKNVVQLYWNVTLQAYVENGTIGENDTVCSADLPTPVPTFKTTIVPVTVSPKPAPSKPSTGTYSVKQENGTCILATMGLQLHLSQGNWTANINPNTTEASGSCNLQTATMMLKDNTTGTIVFGFIAANGRFHLKEVSITLLNKSFDTFSNSNLSYWDASEGSSYMCLREQTIEVVPNVSINTFDLRIQPFKVNNGTFSTAQECSLDDDGILIPIIVGAALAGLIVIIVIAYIIGRRKSYAGYQTL